MNTDLSLDKGRYDVLVVGSGPAGAATALALARLGIQVVVVERSLVRTPRVGEVVPPGVRPALGELGLWEAFRSDGHLPSAGVSVWWGGDQRRDWDYLCGPYGDGWHLDRYRFEDLLIVAAERAGAQLQTGVSVRRVSRTSHGEWLVETAHQAFRCRVLVDAAGRSAFGFSFTGRRVRFDQLVGLAAYFRRTAESAEPEPRLWIEATPTGWWYSAPLPADQMVAAFLTDVDLIEGRAADWHRGCLAAAPVTAARLAGWQILRSPQLYPSETSRVLHFSGRGFLAVGDAAFTSDPLRGHGLVKALRGATRAAEAIQRELSGHEEAIFDWGRETEVQFRDYLVGLTQQYRDERRWAQAPFWRRRHS